MFMFKLLLMSYFFINRKLDYDRIEAHRYEFDVVATDGGNLNASATVQVKTDVIVIIYIVVDKIVLYWMYRTLFKRHSIFHIYVYLQNFTC